MLNNKKVSTSYIQRYLQIGYNRAARIVEKMEEDGIISEANNAGKRHVLKKNKTINLLLLLPICLLKQALETKQKKKK